MKKLKIWNGCGSCIQGFIKTKYNISGRVDFHLYVAAYSKADCIALFDELTDGKHMLNNSVINKYWSADCWGNIMKDIPIERGIWFTEGLCKGNPIRLI